MEDWVQFDEKRWIAREALEWNPTGSRRVVWGSGRSTGLWCRETIEGFVLKVIRQLRGRGIALNVTVDFSGLNCIGSKVCSPVRPKIVVTRVSLNFGYV